MNELAALLGLLFHDLFGCGITSYFFGRSVEILEDFIDRWCYATACP